MCLRDHPVKCPSQLVRRLDSEAQAFFLATCFPGVGVDCRTCENRACETLQVDEAKATFRKRNSLACPGVV